MKKIANILYFLASLVTDGPRPIKKLRKARGWYKLVVMLK